MTTKPKAKAKPKAKPKRRRIKPGEAPGRGTAGTKGQARFTASKEQRDAVMAMAAAGIEQRAISLALRVPLRTLQRHFVSELADGIEVINAKVGGGLAAKALAGKQPYDIYWSKSRMGWRDRTSIGFEDEKGAPVNPSNLFTVQITGG
jgi:hypothetical protein